jgi:hypothetical protein
MKPDVERIPLDRLTLDPRLQMRAGGTDESLAAEYAEVIEDLPPSRAVSDGETLWLAEGWHRHRAHQIAGSPDMPCQVRPGTFLDALIEAAASNHAHGLPRTSEDKRKAVRTLLAENEANRHGWSQRQIARMARVNNHLVAAVASETAEGRNGSSPNSSPSGSNNGSPLLAVTSAPETPSDDGESGDEKPAPELLDEADMPLPPQAVRAFNQLPDLRKLCRCLDQAGRELERLGKDPVGVHLHWQSAQSQLRSARQTVWQGRPAFVCPYCGGKGADCQWCRGHGFVTPATYHSHKKSQEVREGQR